MTDARQTAAALAVTVPLWALTQVNQERVTVPQAGATRLCQAIPAVRLAPVLRWRGAQDTRVTVRVTGPGRTKAVRHETLRRAAGRRSVPFAPAALGLDAFVAGTYRVRVTSDSRVVARGRMRFVHGGAC